MQWEVYGSLSELDQQAEAKPWCSVLQGDTGRGPEPISTTKLGCLFCIKSQVNILYVTNTDSDGLRWYDHIVAICNKANLTSAFLERNLKQSIKSIAYLTYIRLNAG